MNAAANNPVGDEQSARPPGKALMPLLSLRRHWLKSLIVFLVIAGLGLPVAWKKGTASYYGEAVIQVNFRYAPNLSTVQEIETHSDTQYRRLVQQQMRTITRFDVVKEALDSVGEAKSLWKAPAESERQAVQRLQGSLRVNAVRDTYLVTIGLEDQDPTIIPLLVNAVVDSYLKAATEETFFGEDIRLENLRERRDEIEQSIAELTKDLEEAAAKLGLTTFEEGVKNPYDRALADMTDALLKSRQTRVTAEAKLEAMQSKHERLRALSLDAEAQKLAAADRALGDLRAYLYQRRAKLVQTMSGLKSSHAGRQAAEREIVQINEEIEQATVDKHEEMKAILEERRAAEMRSESAELEAELLEAQKVEQALAERVDARRLETKDFMRVYAEGVGVREELERQRRQLSQIRDRIDNILNEKDAPGYVRLVTLATVPELPSSGGRKKLFLIFLMLASGAALVLPLALDFLDNRIHTPVDLHRVLGFAPTSWLPEVRTEADQALFEQQLERLAVALLRELDVHGVGRSVLITESLPGAGKTLVTHRLGDELVRLGMSTLVLSCDPSNESARAEAEARRFDLRDSDEAPPEQRLEPRLEPRPKAVPAAPELGLVDLIAHRATLDEVIRRGAPDEADRIPFGAYADAGQVAKILRLKDVLGELEGRYDLVLVDGPALIVSATTEAIAGICHATLLVVGAIDTPVKPLKRALAMLERADPEVMGAVLNRAPMFRGGGYYSGLAETLSSYRATHGAGEAQDSQGEAHAKRANGHA